MAAKVEALVEKARELKASDIHLAQDSVAYLRLHGTMIPVKGLELTRAEMDALLDEVMPPELRKELDENRSSDFAWQPHEDVRLRATAFYERDRLRMVMRLINMTIASVDDLGLPEVLKTVADNRRGLVIVTGITGSGKSTTLAAIVNHINATRKDCIITIEDPIESIHTNIKSLISQREVGRDVTSFRDGLMQALRQDPDVILIGEMRDPETIITSIRAAETGHFVLSTMHTTNATHTLERIFSEFPEAEHELLREQIANNLKATITQRLVKAEGGGRVPALEIMIVNEVVKKLILEDKVESIATVIRGKTDGMILFDQYLADLVRGEKASEEAAVDYCEDEFAFRRYVKGRKGSGDSGGILG